MTAPPSPPSFVHGPATLARLSTDSVTPVMVQALRVGAVLSPAAASVISLSGSGAVDCMQGLLTSDLDKQGDGGFVYGAMLTPKGMIVVDGWAARFGTEVRFTVPAAGREAALALLGHSVPPRLARTADRSADSVVLRLAGLRALAIAEIARLPAPAAPGRAVRADFDGAALEVARASEGAPFVLQLTLAPGVAAGVQERLGRAGALWTAEPALELARVLAGWPGLTSEVDEKTIPQEVRFDEIGGVSYTKGCYTGQETVSRLHFRGHANRQLRGLEFDAEPPPDAAPLVVHQDREVGRVSSVAWLPESGPGAPLVGRWIGLAVIRREVSSGTMVRAAGVDARVVELPFPLPRLEPA
jgi:folate-binding protein YgfZ